jgi:hypothetical protein
LLFADWSVGNPRCRRGQNFTVTKVTPSRHRPQYDSSHDLFVANVMTRLWRNSVEAAAAVGAIVLATLIVHLVMSWWSASAALH